LYLYLYLYFYFYSLFLNDQNSTFTREYLYKGAVRSVDSDSRLLGHLILKGLFNLF
jgi:hypothetical protein